LEFRNVNKLADTTTERILDIAQKLVQTRGYNAFSYADIATALNVTKASLHYHFPSKADLGQSLIARYGKRFRSLLAAIDSEGATAAGMLRSYVDIYASVLADQRMCLCGMLAAEFETLPKPMQSALDHFFEMNETWIEGVLRRGLTDGTIRAEGNCREQAEFFVAALEGALMLARSHASEARFRIASERLLAQYGV
jgi:TetR/AcrR family transcriptional repressor of nem operon